jgi:hypothetical protein
VNESVHFVSGVKRIHPPTAIVGQVMTETTAPILFADELHKGHSDALLAVKKRGVTYF